MENLGTAKLTTYEVSAIAYYRIVAIFGRYIFHRKAQNRFFIMADKEQERVIREQGMKLKPVPEEEKYGIKDK